MFPLKITTFKLFTCLMLQSLFVQPIFFSFNSAQRDIQSTSKSTMKVFAILLMIKTVFSAPINPDGNQQYLILNLIILRVQLFQMVITVGHL